MSSTTNHYCPDPEKCRLHLTPTPIDPADIRPGDVFQVTYEATCERVTPNGIIVAANNHWSFNPQDGGVISLVHRPDPDAEAVEALRRAHRLTTASDDYATTLKTLRERGWDLVRRQNGQGHA